MGHRGDLTDAQWGRLAPLLPVSNRRCGRWRDHRQVINEVLYRIRTGVQWRDLPERYGPWKTVHERHRRWSADGTWELLLQRVQAEADAAGDIDWDVSVDSTSVRAHRHAVGARLAPPPRPKGGFGKAVGNARIRAELIDLLAEWCRRRGARPLTRRLHHQTPPQRGRSLPPAVDARHSRAAGRLHPVRAGHGTDPGAAPVCRPPGFDKERYKKRNTVERTINRLENFRAVATRYDKRACVYLGPVTAAALMIWLRS
ncbi:IS5 family transposase [Streptomyces puniciscabiei]|uniref:IS5 family transposase n=1 Tax=Streptomyces puniciscabiei TaxID=164348 RepID=UPI003332F16B